jgi:hypothetical protein
MIEYVPPEHYNAIYARANGRCVCENPACGHKPGQCPNDLVDGGVSLPKDTPEKDQVAKGRYCCEECFMLSGSFAGQEAWRRPRRAQS